MAKKPDTLAKVRKKRKQITETLAKLDRMLGDDAAGSNYKRRNEENKARSAKNVAVYNDIAPNMPPVKDRPQRSMAIVSFKFFCETYFPESFPLAWCEDHLKALKKIQSATVQGGLFAFAMPRGSGKTTLCERAVLWAILSGRHKYVALIGADMGKAKQMLAALKLELETNDRLYKDFPWELHPWRELKGEARRCLGQRFQGQRTRVEWTADTIVAGVVPRSQASGAIVQVSGLQASIRGMKHTLVTGEQVRPSLVVLDDPQTRESSASPSQCVTREAIVSGDVLGMAGPGKKIAALMPCTVIYEDDMAHRMLNREKHPDWGGELTKMVYSFPTNTELWEEYEDVRADGLRRNATLDDATNFYLEHREEMDAGASVAWPERFNPDEASALQHAMNLLCRDRGAFYAEYQNEPLPREEITGELVNAETIMEKNNGIKRSVAPTSTVKISAFIDVQQDILFWCRVAWDEKFSGAVLDYGAWPEQTGAYYTLADLRKTFNTTFPRMGFEGQLTAALTAVCSEILGEVQREDEAHIGVDMCMIDSAWQRSTETVRAFCRRSEWRAQLMPSRGLYVGASSEPLGQRKPSKRRLKGERSGFNWVERVLDSQRHLVYDTNFWKSFTHSRFAMALGDKGSLSMFKAKAQTHRMFADHCTSEYSVRTEARQRVVDEWKIRPGRPDNHWFDCLVGCAATASYMGLDADPSAVPVRRKPKLGPRHPAPAVRVGTPHGRDGRSFFVTAR